MIGIESSEGFTRITESKIKCSAGLNVHGERIKLIVKSDNHACYPSCESKETWEHVLLCEKLKDKREVWIKRLSNKIKDASKNVKASMYERNIVN